MTTISELKPEIQNPFGLVTKKLMGTGRAAEEGPGVRNPGARWWRDTNATRDTDLIILKHDKPPRTRPPSRSSSPSRGRSRTARGDRGRGSTQGYPKEDDEGVIRTLDTTRDDYSWTETTPHDTIDHWFRVVYRQHKNGALRDPTDFERSGVAPHGMQFLKGTTYLNLVQFIKLNRVHTMR